MKVQLDLKRLTEVQDLMGAELPEIVGSLTESMRASIERLEESMAAEDLDGAARAAHACRNDALMVGARQILEALTDLEAAARAGQLRAAGEALERTQSVWPATLEQLQRAAER
jgi:HPt (histidine-containing phosphotransfer) domain-containing protein